MSLDLISNDNEAFRGYAFWVGILILKTLAMSILTAMKRMKNKVSPRGQHPNYFKWIFPSTFAILIDACVACFASDF